MKIVRTSKCAVTFLCAALSFLAGCSKKEEKRADTPRLNSRVTMRDVVFHSVALNRDMPYRVVFPASIAAGHKLPVVYLLHGLGGGFRDWTNYSDVANFAEGGLILVMPEGDSSYYVNSAQRPQDR
jgi:S-formylglutathione hydrolase FrmB